MKDIGYTALDLCIKSCEVRHRRARTKSTTRLAAVTALNDRYGEYGNFVIIYINILAFTVHSQTSPLCEAPQ